MKKKSQNERILDYLKEGKLLTQVEASYKFQCWRLAARIRDLRIKGNLIETHYRTMKSGKRIAEYKLFTTFIN